MIRINPILPNRPLVNAQAVYAAAQRAMTNTVIEGARYMAEYPVQRLTKTKYRRTGTLKRSWSFKVEAGAAQIVGIVGSNAGMAPYNREVQGESGEQKAMFRERGGWQNIDDLKKRLEAEWNRNEGLIERELGR